MAGADASEGSAGLPSTGFDAAAEDPGAPLDGAWGWAFVALEALPEPCCVAALVCTAEALKSGGGGTIGRFFGGSGIRKAGFVWTSEAPLSFEGCAPLLALSDAAASLELIASRLDCIACRKARRILTRAWATFCPKSSDLDL